MPRPSPYPAKLCVSLAAATSDAILALARQAAPQADVLEIRLDAMTEPAVAPLVAQLTTPLLFTNRAAWEGGNFAGPEEARLELLRQAVAAKAAYIDVELKTEAARRDPLISEAQAQGTSVIVSWHSFDGTPSSQALRTILQEQYRSQAAIGKIVTMARDIHDVLRVLNLQTEAADLGLPLIAFCMGRIGMISRVATLGLGGFMTYAAADGSAVTAPGQLSISALCRITSELDHVG